MTAGEAQVTEAMEQHTRAVQIVQSYADELAPYALFLRNFDVESMRVAAESKDRNVQYVALST